MEMSALSQTFAFNSPSLYYITDIQAVKLQSSGLCGIAKSSLEGPVVWYNIIVQRNPHEAGRLRFCHIGVVQDLTHSEYSMRTKAFILIYYSGALFIHLHTVYFSLFSANPFG